MTMTNNMLARSGRLLLQPSSLTLVDHADTGFLVPDRDPDVFARHVASLLDDPGAELARDVARGVGRARVDDDHLVAERPCGRERAADRGRLVTGDHAEAESRALSLLHRILCGLYRQGRRGLWRGEYGGARRLRGAASGDRLGEGGRGAAPRPPRRGPPAERRLARIPRYRCTIVPAWVWTPTTMVRSAGALERGGLGERVGRRASRTA